MSNAVTLQCLGIVSMARRPKQTAKTKQVPPATSVGFGMSKRKEPLWQCVEGCGACCKLDKGPSFATPEEIFTDPADIELYRSMVGSDGWCVHFDKGTRKCSIYNDRPYFCRVEADVFDKLYGISKKKFNMEACRKNSTFFTYSIITSLSLSGFAHFAHALHSHNLSATRPTCFVAPDSAFLGRLVSPNTVRAHIHAAGALPFKTLLQLPLNTALPTLHHNTSLIFGTDGKRVSFNDVLITAPNLHVDDSCVVHGVEGPLVPMPSLTDDEDDDLTRAKIAVKSPQELPKPPRRRFAEVVVRFIRRAHRPILGDQNQDTNLP